MPANAVYSAEAEANLEAGRKYDVMLIWQGDFADFLAF